MLETRPIASGGTHSSTRFSFGYRDTSRMMDTLAVIQISTDFPLSIAVISPGEGVQAMVGNGPVPVGCAVIGYLVSPAASVYLRPTRAVPVARSPGKGSMTPGP